MTNFHYIIYLLTFYPCFFHTGHSVDVNKCFFTNSTKDGAKLIDVISTLVGQNFMTEKDGYKYTVSICSDISKEHEFGSVMQTKNKEIVILGRRNETHIIHGENWMILSYGCGDLKMDKKSRRRASITLVCSPDGHKDQSHIELVEENGLDYKFILPTESVCSYNDEISGMKIFLIIVSVTLSVYCLIGILYRRFVDNERSCQQIPNFRFWNRIGNSLADGCDYVCRCDAPEDTWDNNTNYTSNFESRDRDDALLRP